MKHINTLKNISNLLEDSYTHLEGKLLLEKLKKDIINDFHEFDKIKNNKVQNHDDINELIIAFNDIAQIEIMLGFEKELSISFDYISILYYKYHHIAKTENEKTTYLSLAIQVAEHAVNFSRFKEEYSKRYHQYLKNYAHHIKSKHPEIAEQLYLKVLDYCENNTNSVIDYSLMKSACYDGLGSIYLNYSDKENATFDDKERYLNDSQEYYEKSLNLLKNQKKNSTGPDIAHILSTVILKKARHYINALKRNNFNCPKLELLEKLKICHLNAISFAQDYNDLRKIGHAKYQYSFFLADNQDDLLVKNDEILTQMKDAIIFLLKGYLEEGQINKDEYDLNYNKCLSVSHNGKENAHDVLARYRSINDSLIKQTKNKSLEFKEYKKKRKLNQLFYQDKKRRYLF